MEGFNIANAKNLAAKKIIVSALIVVYHVEWIVNAKAAKTAKQSQIKIVKTTQFKSKSKLILQLETSEGRIVFWSVKVIYFLSLFLYIMDIRSG